MGGLTPNAVFGVVTGFFKNARCFEHNSMYIFLWDSEALFGGSGVGGSRARAYITPPALCALFYIPLGLRFALRLTLPVYLNRLS